jgi:hypothetical protein
MVEKSIAARGALVGACAWMLGANSIGDYDGYTLYLPPTTPASDSMEELKRFAKLRGPAAVKAPATKPSGARVSCPANYAALVHACFDSRFGKPGCSMSSRRRFAPGCNRSAGTGEG